MLEGRVRVLKQKVPVCRARTQAVNAPHLQNSSARRGCSGVANLRARGQSAASEVRLDVKLLGVTAWAHSFGLRRAHAPAEAINLEKVYAAGSSLVPHSSVESVRTAVMAVS